MALAEARAAWQRMANRCLVQEDAKRAPKLACCSSVPPSAKQAETGPTSPPGSQDIPTVGSLPFNRSPSYSDLSPNSRWWLQLPPNYGYQKGLMDEQFTGDLARNEDDSSSGLIDQTSNVEFPFDNEYRDFITCDKKDFGDKEEKFRDEGIFSCEVSKNGHDIYFDSESSWMGGERNIPWWRTADTEELALLVAQRSLEFVENCDLPRPQDTRVKKDLNVDICYFGSDKISSPPVNRNFGVRGRRNLHTHDSVPSSLSAGGSCQKLRMSAEGKLVSGADKQLRGGGTHVRTSEMPVGDDDTSKSKLLEALRHSQTRAREAEKVAKQACAEKEHVVKLVFRQASQLFAYKQWLHLLQLENMYFQFRNKKSQSTSTVFPIMLPWTSLRTRKTRKGWQKSWSGKRAKRPRLRYDVGKYAVAFALGLGLVGAGLFLGWTIGWMLPSW